MDQQENPSSDQAGPASSAAETLERWVAAVCDRDPARATALYAADAMVFWGTFGDHCRVTSDDTRSYFDRFLDVESLACRVIEANWRELGDSVAVVGGWYEFDVLRHGASEPATVKARLTFTFHRTETGEWRIVVHHSSLFPEDGY